MHKACREYAVRLKRLGYDWDDLMQVARMVLHRASQLFQTDDEVQFRKYYKTALRRKFYDICQTSDAMSVSLQLSSEICGDYVRDWIVGHSTLDTTVCSVNEFLSKLPTSLHDLTLARMSGMSKQEVCDENGYSLSVVDRDLKKLRKLYKRYERGDAI